MTIEGLELWATRMTATCYFWPFLNLIHKNGCKGIFTVRIDDGIYEYVIHKESFEEAINKCSKLSLEKKEIALDNYLLQKNKILNLSEALSKEVENKNFNKLPGLFRELNDYLSHFAVFMVFPHWMERYLEPTLAGKNDFIEASALGKRCDYHILLSDLHLLSDVELKERYGYLGYFSQGNGRSPANTEYFKSLQEENSKEKIGQLLKFIDDNEAKFQQIINETQNADEMSLLQIVHDMAYIRTDRVDVIRKSIDNLRSFYEYVGNLNNEKLSFDEVLFLMPEEVSDILEGKFVEENDISRRLKDNNVLFEISDTVTGFREDKDFVQSWNNRKLENKEVTEIKGQIAYKGVARGKVAIIEKGKSIKDSKDFILVAKHTDPSNLHAMSQSLAIVTDEGGITSHAAIVARELKKPCIIGTKIATKVLKDGDMVEVNADKGIVKILK